MHASADARIYFTEVHNGLQRLLHFKNYSLIGVIYMMVRFKKTVFFYETQRVLIEMV